MTAAPAEIGVIGGSGFYSLDGLTEAERVAVPTPVLAYKAFSFQAPRGLW